MSSLYLALTVDDQRVVDQLAACQGMVKQAVGNGRNGVDWCRWMDPSTFHVTVDFLGDDEEGFEKVVRAMRAFERTAGPELRGQRLRVRGVHRFDGGALWLGLDNSLVLYRIHHALRELMDAEGYVHRPDDFPEYTPHLTIGYDAPAEVPAVDLGEGVEVPVSTIALWNSPKCAGAYIDNALCTVSLR